MTNRTAEILSANVRAEMGRAGHRQGALAQVLGVSGAAVSARMTGRQELSVSELRRIASWLDVPLSVLMHGTDVPVEAAVAS